MYNKISDSLVMVEQKRIAMMTTSNEKLMTNEDDEKHLTVQITPSLYFSPPIPSLERFDLLFICASQNSQSFRFTCSLHNTSPVSKASSNSAGVPPTPANHR